ncbi:endonuclease III [Desulfocurvibacter africanus PCS]|uniref:Endonuclease III n=1 Tax=Desulfocurvibacter africanus PCS TaxID=1262666 RepID=M5PVB6_DESAF|nr:endonuclease III [Desulfocurvibacter africanus]EMG37984.1 endonuclease III [Desulfocurvibacter africanus PCS]
MTTMPTTLRERARIIHERLRQVYDPHITALDWTDPWQLMVATVLAAQCTDERVNQVTPELFRRWPGPAELRHASQAELEEVIRSTGFFRNKAKNLLAAANLIMDKHGGEMPRTMAEMVEIPGVARKTANIVLSTALGVVEGIAVDTHVKRLSFRLGLTESDKPERIERDLMEVFEREIWGEVNHLLVQHGRAVCQARLPRCSACLLADICPKLGVTKSA